MLNKNEKKYISYFIRTIYKVKKNVERSKNTKSISFITLKKLYQIMNKVIYQE